MNSRSSRAAMVARVSIDGILVAGVTTLIMGVEIDAGDGYALWLQCSSHSNHDCAIAGSDRVSSIFEC